MQQNQQNKMAVVPVGKLMWGMGLPMIVSMILQALYNVVDSICLFASGAVRLSCGLSVSPFRQRIESRMADVPDGGGSDLLPFNVVSETGTEKPDRKNISP